MRNVLSKKGQSLGGLYSGILIIASIGILLALILYILSSMGDSFKIQNTAGDAVTGETGYINQTGYTLNTTYSSLEDFTPTITAWNTTSGQTILSGNWTETSGLIVNASTTEWEAVSFNYTWTYTAGTDSSDATDTMVTQFVDFLPWLGIILLVLAAGVVLFFVIRSFSGTGKGV